MAAFVFVYIFIIHINDLVRAVLINNYCCGCASSEGTCSSAVLGAGSEKLSAVQCWVVSAELLKSASSSAARAGSDGPQSSWSRGSASVPMSITAAERTLWLLS